MGYGKLHFHFGGEIRVGALSQNSVFVLFAVAHMSRKATAIILIKIPINIHSVPSKYPLKYRIPLLLAFFCFYMQKIIKTSS